MGGLLKRLIKGRNELEIATVLTALRKSSVIDRKVLPPETSLAQARYKYNFDKSKVLVNHNIEVNLRWLEGGDVSLGPICTAGLLDCWIAGAEEPFRLI